MVDEMLKLRDLLTKIGIEWQDASTPPNYPLRIDRTHFNYRGFNWSVINEFGVVRGYDVFDIENKGLLKLVSEAVNNGEPIRHLTADNVIKFVLYPKETFGLAALNQITLTFNQMLAKELKLIKSSNNARKMRHEPMFRRYAACRGRRIKRTQPKQGKQRNKRHKYT